MTNKILFSILIGFTLTSCQKEDNSMLPTQGLSEQRSSQTQTQTVAPTTFKQKLLMEMYSTAGCATCPDAELKYRNYAAQYPDRVYGVCVHTSDAMSSPQYSFLNSLFNITVFSSGSFNRLPYNGNVVLPKTAWASSGSVASSLNKIAKCGLKISTALNGTILSGTATAGFNQSLTGSYYMTIYLIEDSVTGTGSGYNQTNYYNAISTSPFYQMGNPIIGYNHNTVLRSVLTPAIGTPIASAYIHSGGTFSKSFTIDVSSYDKPQLTVVAFINKAGSTSLLHEVMNAQRVKAGQTKNWD